MITIAVLMWVVLGMAAVLFIAMVIWGVSTEWGNAFSVIGAVIFAIVLFVMFFVAPITHVEWYRAGREAKIINKEFDTSYTQEDLFWTEPIIIQVNEGTKERLEVDLR